MATFINTSGGTGSTIWTTWWEDSATISTDTVWHQWTTTSSSTSNATINIRATQIWTNWVDDVGTCVVSNYIAPRKVTEQEKAEAERRRKEALKAERERQRLEAMAIAKAERLLHMVLDEDQKRQFKRDRFIVVQGRRARYRIRPGRVANVDVVGPDGRIMHRLCAHPAPQVPNFDTMVAQKLMLDACEDEFLRIANVHRWDIPPHAVLPPIATLQ